MSRRVPPSTPAAGGRVDPVTQMIPAIEATGAIPLRNGAMPLRRSHRGGKRLKVDWPACKAHGLCHEILPERIGRDEWGYPVLGRGVLQGSDLEEARRAVAVCPTLALRLVDPTAR